MNLTTKANNALEKISVGLEVLESWFQRRYIKDLNSISHQVHLDGSKYILNAVPRILSRVLVNILFQIQKTMGMSSVANL